MGAGVDEPFTDAATSLPLKSTNRVDSPIDEADLARQNWESCFFPPGFLDKEVLLSAYFLAYWSVYFLVYRSSVIS